MKDTGRLLIAVILLVVGLWLEQDALTAATYGRAAVDLPYFIASLSVWMTHDVAYTLIVISLMILSAPILKKDFF